MPECGVQIILPATARSEAEIRAVLPPRGELSGNGVYWEINIVAGQRETAERHARDVLQALEMSDA